MNGNDRMHSVWYFDLISPFAYLQSKQMQRLPADLKVEYTPVLLAGLLAHWGQMGPAEIPPKRIYTYRYAAWLAKRCGVSFKMPPCHPFNPLHALRLLCAAGPTPTHVALAFDMVWEEGRDLQDPQEIAELGRRLAIDDIEAVLADNAIKTKLRNNTEAAISNGVFGVPTFVIGDSIFWGQDSFDMFLEYLSKPGLFDTPEMLRISELPLGALRRAPTR